MELNRIALSIVTALYGRLTSSIVTALYGLTLSIVTAFYGLTLNRDYFMENARVRFLFTS